MNGNATVFGVNFADGRIKGYPKAPRGPGGREEKRLYVRYVRGNPAYGRNEFHDNGDGTISDRAAGLSWQKADSGKPLDWEQALAYAESLTLAGHDDWRLPNLLRAEHGIYASAGSPWGAANQRARCRSSAQRSQER